MSPTGVSGPFDGNQPVDETLKWKQEKEELPKPKKMFKGPRHEKRRGKKNLTHDLQGRNKKFR